MKHITQDIIRVCQYLVAVVCVLPIVLLSLRTFTVEWLNSLQDNGDLKV